MDGLYVRLKTTPNLAKLLMMTILVLVAVTTGLGAYFLYPKRPFVMRLVTGFLLLLCFAAISALIFGPSDLMERLPSNLTNVGHPWVLGSLAVASGILFLSCALGSFVGCLTAQRCRQRQGEQAAP